MTDEKVAFEFSTAGARTLADDTLRLTIDIEPRDAAQAFAAFGQRGVKGAIAVLQQNVRADHSDDVVRTDHRDGVDTRPRGWWVSELYQSGWFLALPVLRALGEEHLYAEFVRDKSCRNCGEIDVEYAHVRRAGEAGTGFKPPYRAIALCHACHMLQHHKGESALDIDMDRELRLLLQEWGHDRLRLALHTEHLASVPRDDFLRWCEANDIENTLPHAVRPVPQDSEPEVF